MSHDEILRSYAVLNSLKNNIPDDYEVEDFWVRDFNTAVEKIEKVLSIDLSEFKVTNENLYRSVSSWSPEEGDQYLPGLWCKKSVLMYKIDSILTYFTGLQAPEDKKIGFIKP